MASYETGEYHYDKQTLLSEHELLLTRTQTNTIDSSIQTIELQTSKLIELNNLRAIKISDLTPGHNNANKLIYSTQITPIATAEVIYFIIEDEYSNVCRVSIPANVDTVHLVKGVRLAFSNPNYKMAFDGRYSLVVHNTSNISLLQFDSFAQLKSETGFPSSRHSHDKINKISTTEGNNMNEIGNAESEQISTTLNEDEIDSTNNQLRSVIENNQTDVQSKLLNQEQQEQEERTVTKPSIYLSQIVDRAGGDSSRIGSKLFKEGRYTNAIVQCTCAILANSKSAMFYSNRGLCYLKIGELEYALTDFKRATQLDPESFNCQYLVALTWSKIGNHNLSLDLLRKIKPKNNTDIYELEKIIKEEEKFTENIKGKFDFIAMRRDETKQNKIGEFIGPIQILPSPKHGRGLFTTRRVKKGENLCVVKAIELLDTNLSNCGCDNCRKKTIKNAPLKESLFAKVVECARKSKLTTARLVSLCDTSIKKVNIGLYSSCGHEFAKNFDTSLYPVDKLQTLVEDNLYLELDHFDPAGVFHSPNVFPSNSLFPKDISLESFSLEAFTSRFQLSKPLSPMVPFFSGVWLLPSFINHSCMPNAYKIFIRDVCIVRAITDIPEGEEVFASYCRLSLFTSTPVRHEFLGFKCECNYCEFEKKSHVMKINSEIFSMYQYLQTFDNIPHCVKNSAVRRRDTKQFTREIWLDIKNKIILFAKQLKLNKKDEFFSMPFQSIVFALMRMNVCRADAFELFLEAEPYISIFEPETYLLCWYYFSMFFCTDLRCAEDIRYAIADKKLHEIQDVFT